jgi:hypothetical protein
MQRLPWIASVMRAMATAGATPRNKTINSVNLDS